MDLAFIAGEFFDQPVPKDKAYLNHYFPSEIQQQFLRYMLVFRDSRHFCDHTGFVCTLRHLQVLGRRLRIIEETRARAQESLDFETLERLEKGKCTVRAL